MKGGEKFYDPVKAAEAKRRANRLTTVLAVLLGGFGIAAVFVYLDKVKPRGAQSEPVDAQLVIENKAPLVPATRANPIQAKAAPVMPDPVVESGIVPPESPVVEKVEVAKSESELLAGEGDLVLTGLDSLRDDAKQRDAALLERTMNGKAWNAYRELLSRSIQAGVGKLPAGSGLNRFDPLWNEAAFYQAFLRWRILGVFSESQIVSVVQDEYSGAMWLWLLRNNQAMEEVLLTVHAKDDAGAVLKFLTDAWSVNEQDYEKYFSLALACAVVFDRPVPIPHPLGEGEYGVEQTVDGLKRYRWYILKNDKGKLAAPVHHSSARDLVWVVCAPVATSELEWAIDKLHYRRSKWGEAFGSIEYLMERAVEGLNPYKEYSFAEILKEGGICGDQSYFCVNTARAQGIPAMTLAGETDSGGHAWVGLKISKDEWTTDVGRIQGASRGTADNPQIGGEITEQEIRQWNDRHQQSRIATLAVGRLSWLADWFGSAGKDRDEAATIRLCNRIGQSFPETWKALYALLERETKMVGEPKMPGNLDAWKAFAADMRRQFKDNPRMAQLAADAEMEYIFPYGPEGDVTRSLVRERRRIERDSGEQKDLIASSLKRESDLIMQRGGADARKEVSRLYDRALRDFGGSLTAFKMMAGDYFRHMRPEPELARKAVRDIELAFKRVIETGTKDWFRANAESEIYRMICGYYREIGESDRAEMLEKRVEVLLRRSKRGAL